MKSCKQTRGLASMAWPAPGLSREPYPHFTPGLFHRDGGRRFKTEFSTNFGAQNCSCSPENFISDFCHVQGFPGLRLLPLGAAEANS